MKNNIYIFAFLFLGSIISACESDDLYHQNDFKSSQKAWLEFKEMTNNSYKYTAVLGSWIGLSWETTITVFNGEIIERHFKYIMTDALSDHFPEDELEWIENENEIGIHKNLGAEPLTLDQIYIKAEKEWLQKSDNYKTYFETENNGLISICGYVENGCMDHCFVGIHINSIESL
jgi:hypothetical protein